MKNKGCGRISAVGIGRLLEETVERQLLRVVQLCLQAICPLARLTEAEQQLALRLCSSGAHVVAVSPRVLVFGTRSGIYDGPISER